MIDLGTLGGDYGEVNWMNNSGQVVGFSEIAGDAAAHPFLWNGWRMIDLGTLGGAGATRTGSTTTATSPVLRN
jgi:probable HAF family extracellular repeat protein